MEIFHKIYKKIWVSILIVLIISWALIPLFHKGFFTIHDDEQIGRLVEMTKVLLQGQIPPRWVPDLGFGFGYPLFNFYPPFVYYLGFIVHVLNFSFINSTKIVIGIGFLLSALFMYLWTKNRFGIIAGLFAAFLYTYAPYHSVDIYVRGALSEFFSFVWIPAVLWILDILVKKPTLKKLAVSGIFLALVPLTHSLVALQFAPFLTFYMLFLMWEERKRLKIILPYFFAVGILGIGLSAYFIFPSLIEKQYTLVDSVLITQLANYSIHFVCPSQLWNSLWGYGGSVAGCVDGLSFQVGKIHILVSLIALITVIVSLFWNKKSKAIVLFGFTMFALSLFMTTDYSKFIWDHFQPYWYIQFPWRFLLFSAVFSSFLGGSVLSYLGKLVGNKYVVIICLILSAAALYQIRNDFRPQTYLPVGDDYYIKNQDIEWRVSRMSYEYVPKEVVTRLSSLHTTEVAISKNDIPKMPFTVISGSMNIKTYSNTATKKVATIKVLKLGILQINTYAFPGWKTFIDGKKVSYSDNNSLHLMQLYLSQGQHTIIVLFENTTIRNISDIISLISFFVLLILLFWPRKAV